MGCAKTEVSVPNWTKGGRGRTAEILGDPVQAGPEMLVGMPPVEIEARQVAQGDARSHVHRVAEKQFRIDLGGTDHRANLWRLAEA